MNNEYMNGIYTAFIRVSELKLMVLRWLQLCYFASGLRPLANSTIKSPRAHSFYQSLSWPYMFVYFALNTNLPIEWDKPKPEKTATDINPRNSNKDKITEKTTNVSSR